MANNFTKTDYEASDKLLLEIIYDGFKKSNNRVVNFDTDTKELFLTLSLLDQSKTYSEEKIKWKNEIGLYNIIEMRLSAFDYTITPPTILFLCFVSEAPGAAILYLHYLQIVSKKLELSEINMEILGMRIFPNGFLDNKLLEIIWDNQKFYEGNLVDIATPYQSNKR